MDSMGQAGRRLGEINATEGAAGNISVYVGWPLEPRRTFPVERRIELPGTYAELQGKSFLVSGSGQRLRDIHRAPTKSLAFLTVEEPGDSATLHTAPECAFRRPTSELNTHLAIHAERVQNTGIELQALLHAQPPYLTYLSHIPAYQDTLYLNRHVLRWQPELIAHFPEGIGYVPFFVPGSAELEAATRQAMRDHKIVVWAKHGIMARSDRSAEGATDLIEYVEAGARYEYMNLVGGGVAHGLSEAEMRQICEEHGVTETIFDDTWSGS